MWIFLVCLFFSVAGVSFSNNCSEIRNISVFPKELFTLHLDEDEVEENSLVDGSGTDIARINKSGELTLLDEHYKDKLSAKGFSFHIQNASIKGQEQFTTSIVYKNGTHCSQHYLVIVRGDQKCSENKEIRCTFPDCCFTLDFNSTGVEKITWVGTNGLTIGITKHKAILQILDSKFEGKLSVIGVSLRKHSPITKDHGQYTARVIFQNGTWCLQHYYVTIYDYQWYDFLIPRQNSPIAITYFTFGFFLGLFGEMIRRCWLKTKEKKNESEQNQSGHLQWARLQGESLELTNMTRQRRIEPPHVTNIQPPLVN